MADAPDLPPGYTLDERGKEPLALPPGYTLDTGSQGSLQSGPALVGTGLYQGLRDPINSGAVMLARGLSAVAPQGSSLAKWANDQLSAAEAANTANESAYAKLVGANPGAAAGRTLGNIGAALPIAAAVPGGTAEALLPKVAQGMASGAFSGALRPAQPGTSGANYWDEISKNALEGAGMGGIAPLVFGTAARIAQPAASSRVSPLLQAGVTPTIGQTLGGTINRLEQAATSIPIAGDIVKNARARPLEQFGRGAINEALAPIGESLDPGTPMGRDAIAEMQSKASNAYGQLLPGLTWQADPQFARDATQLVQMSRMMPADRARQFHNLFANQVLDNISPAGAMSGEMFKDVESIIGQEANSYLHSSSADERKYGSAALQLQALLRDALTRSNPDQAQELGAANLTWANMKRVQRAAAAVGAPEGNFTPAQLLSAVKAQTPESQFARGGGLLQPYAEAGKSVLGSTLPDSGTPYRGLLPLLTLEGLEHPEALLYGGAAGLGAAGLYSRPAQWMLSRAAASRPEFAGSIAQWLRALSPYGAAAAPQIFGGLSPVTAP